MEDGIGNKSIKVLLIEDNPDDVFLIKEYLEDANDNYELGSAETLDDGIQAIFDDGYDIILLDLGLPDSNGFETFEATYKNSKNVPIIVLTGLDDEELVGKTVRSGAQDYLIKSELDTKILSKAINYAIERKKFQIEIKESEQKFKTVADFTYDWEYWIDPEGNLLYISPSCERISGYKPDDFIKNPGLIEEITHPDDIQILQEHHSDFFSTEIESEIEFRIYKKNGDLIWISHNCQPVFGENSEFLGRRASNKDINDKKLAENLIKESEERYRNLFNYMVDGVAVYTPTNNGETFVFKDLNQAAERIDDIKRENVLGKEITKVFPGVEDFGILEVIKRVYKTGEPEHHPISKYQDHRISGWRDNFVYKLPTGEIVSVYEDVTKRVKADEELKNVNKILQEREEQLRLFIENAPAAIAMFDTQMNYISVSNRWISEFKLEGIELIGQSHYEVFPSVKDEWKEAHKRALSGSIVRNEEDNFVQEDGSVQWLKWETIPWYLASGGIGGIIIFSEDITDLKLANDALKESEAKYRYVIETAEEGIVIFDYKGTIMEINPKALDLMGITDYIVGKNLMELAPTIKVNSKDALGAFEEIIDGGPLKKQEWEYTNKMGKKKFVKVNYSIMRKEDQLEGIALVMEDITDLKLRQKALRENEQFLEKIIENIPDMIFVKDVDELKFQRVNKASEQIWGYDRDELIGHSDYDFFTEDEADFYTKNDMEVINKKELRDIPEERIHTNYLGERILHTKKIPLLDEKGKPNYLLGISEDITERKSAELEIQKSLEEKEVLLKEIHHRVKNNMQIISSMLNLQTGYVHEEETKNILKDSQSRVKSMAMIHEKLYMSNDLSHINFRDYAEKLVSDIFYTYSVEVGTIEPIVKIEHIELNMETAIPLGLIINELVTNSLKFAFPDQDKGTVTVKLEAKGGEQILTVKDDGIGFPDHIDYKNVDSLGLRLVNSLVHQINGELTLLKNHGTRFEIRFKELDYKKRF